MNKNNKIDIEKLIAQLSKTRPIFHSEADFQHALAWEIHIAYPQSSIRLENNPYPDGQRIHLDILATIHGVEYGIELKYKTRKVGIECNREIFRLLNQSAQDTGRYDFIKDIVRLERFTTERKNSKGIVIFLTNDSGYWEQKISKKTVDQAFRIYEKRTLEGNLTWGNKASSGTVKGREKSLILNNRYRLNWRNYSQLENTSKGIFKYLLLNIGS